MPDLSTHGLLKSHKTLERGDLLAEDLSRKFFDPRLLSSPTARRQSGLDAGLVQKGLAVPSILCGHLRQQQPRKSPAADDEPVSADYDLLNVSYRLDRPHHRNLQFELRHLLRLNGKESRIAHRGRHGARGNSLEKRLDRANRPDASPQIPVFRSQRHECTGGPAEGVVEVVFAQHGRTTAEHRFNRCSCELQELSALFFVEHGK